MQRRLDAAKLDLEYGETPGAFHLGTMNMVTGEESFRIIDIIMGA